MTENQIYDDKVDFEASPYEVVINGEKRVGGWISFSMKQNPEKRDVLSSETYNQILMDGSLITRLYIADIKTLETRRFFIEGIEVYQESFDSNNDDISYLFRAKSIRIKYQETETPKEMEERLSK